ncbi:MAG: HAD hydrolase family protein, partial [Planctomycetes bacterium]|nr:HAD hydrolase family protein [Planctomycetota bacterium]
MHIKQVSLVALDLDGTLLDTNSEISPTNESILRYIDKLGVYVVIATSRRYEDAKRYQINLPLNTIWICTSGAEIRIIDGKVSLRDERLPKAFSEQVIATFDHLGVEYAICIDGIIYKKSSKYKILSDNIVEIPHIYPVLSVGNPSHFIIIGDTSINLVQSSELSTPLLDNSIQYYFPVDNRQPFPRMHLLPLRTNKA